MTNEEYIELNEYLNEAFMQLEKYDFFFIDNIEMIEYINSLYCELVGEYEFDTSKKDQNLTYEEVYNLAREIIESINPNYLELFDNMINNGDLDFDYEDKYTESHVMYKLGDTERFRLVNIKRTYNYEEVKMLVHEFIHYTNSTASTVRRHILSEYLSISAELYAEDYMLNKGINIDDVNSSVRLESTYQRCADFSWVFDALIVYKELGSLNNENLKFAEENIIDIPEEELKTQCKRLLYSIREYNKKQEKEPEDKKAEFYEQMVSLYQYLLGTVFGFYTKDHVDKKVFVDMNDHINDDNEETAIDYLLKAGIEIEDMDKLFEPISLYLDKVKSKKR